MLKPMDIHNKEFRKVVRGYDAEEVDEFLDEIIVDFERMQRELDLLRNQLNNYSDTMATYKEREIALNNAIVSAQQFADHVKKESEEKAANIIRQAEEEAKNIIGATEQKYHNMLKGYQILASKYNDARGVLKDYLEGQIKLLDNDEAAFQNPEEMIAFIAKEKQPLEEVQAEKVMQETATAENDETKINMKLKEMLEAQSNSDNVTEEKTYRY